MLNIIFYRYWQWKGSSENKNCWRPCKRSFRQQRSRRNPGILVWRRNIWIMPTRMQKKVVFCFYKFVGHWLIVFIDVRDHSYFQPCEERFFNRHYSLLVAVRLSGILEVKQKLGVTFNSDKLGGIDFTKFSKLTMCSA